MTNVNVEKRKRKKKNTQNESYNEVNSYKKWKKSSGNKGVFTKTILTYGKAVTMSSRTQTTEVLLRWKYVTQAVGRALCRAYSWTVYYQRG